MRARNAHAIGPGTLPNDAAARGGDARVWPRARAAGIISHHIARGIRASRVPCPAFPAPTRTTAGDPLRRTTPGIAAVLLALTSALACARSAERFPAPIPPVPATPRTQYVMRYVDIAPGTGAPAEARKCLYAHYTGWLTNGTKFDSSHDTTDAGAPRPPLAFPKGARRVIPGWDAGFEGMRVGGRRRLIIPYQLAYGERGRPPRIPPKATLVFDVELMGVADTLARPDTTEPPRTPAAAAPQCPPWAAVSGRPT